MGCKALSYQMCNQIPFVQIWSICTGIVKFWMKLITNATNGYLIFTNNLGIYCWAINLYKICLLDCKDLSFYMQMCNQILFWLGGVLTLTWYTYLCLPFRVLSRKFWYSDQGFLSQKKGQIYLDKLGVFWANYGKKTPNLSKIWCLCTKLVYWWVGNGD